MIIEKPVLSTPYYVTLTAHVVTAYTVNLLEDVVTVTVASYFSKEALSHTDAQALSTNSIVIKGKPDKKDVLEWIGEQLTVDSAERVEDEWNYQAGHQIGDRLMFAGGKVVN